MKIASVALAAVASVALASSVVPRSLDDRVRLADRVVFAQVVSQRTENVGTPDKPKLVTYHHVLVAEDFKGSGPMELDVAQLGGQWGLWEQRVTDDARFVVGESAVMLLSCPARLKFCRLFGLADAKLTVSGDDVLVRDMFTGAWSRQKLAELGPHLKALKGPPETVTVRGQK